MATFKGIILLLLELNAVSLLAAGFFSPRKDGLLAGTVSSLFHCCLVSLIAEAIEAGACRTDLKARCTCLII